MGYFDFVQAGGSLQAGTAGGGTASVPGLRDGDLVRDGCPPVTGTWPPYGDGRSFLLRHRRRSGRRLSERRKRSRHESTNENAASTMKKEISMTRVISYQ